MSIIMQDQADKSWLNDEFDEHWADEPRQPSPPTKINFLALVLLLISIFLISKIAGATTPTPTPKTDLSNLKSPDLVSYLKKYPQIITLYDIE